MDKNEFISRRDFFKKSIKKALPILAGIAFGPTLLAACNKEDEELEKALNCGGGCNASCYNSSNSSSCSSCGNGCGSQCSNNSTSSTCTTCGNGCGKACSNDCTSGCDGQCYNGCMNGCGGECKNACYSCNAYCSYGAKASCSGCGAQCKNNCSTQCTYGCYKQVKNN